MLLTKRQLKVHHLASTDDTRPVLTQVYAYKKDGETVAVATDSYILGEVRESSTPVEDFPTINQDSPNEDLDEVFIPKDVAESAISALPKKKILPILGYALAQKDEVITTDLNRTTKFVTKEQEGKFPDYQKLVPEPAEFQVRLNPDKLRQALEVFKGDSFTDISIEFGKTPLDPVVLRGQEMGSTTTVLVMPLKK